MLFKELIEQHRVHCVVAHSIGFALCVANHQSGVDPFDFLSHEAKLRDALGINSFLVMEGDRFKGKNRFADLVHWLNFILEPRRGRYRTQLAVRSHKDLALHAASAPFTATTQSQQGARLSAELPGLDRKL